MTQFKAFADDAAQVTVGDDFAIENGTDTVSIHGNLDVHIDKEGLRAATALRDAAQSIVDALSHRDLPEKAKIAPVENGTVDNPF